MNKYTHRKKDLRVRRIKPDPLTNPTIPTELPHPTCASARTPGPRHQPSPGPSPTTTMDPLQTGPPSYPALSPKTAVWMEGARPPVSSPIPAAGFPTFERSPSSHSNQGNLHQTTTSHTLRLHIHGSPITSQGFTNQDYFTIKVCSVGISDRRRDVTQGNPLRPSEWGFKIGYFRIFTAISAHLAAFH